MMAGYGEPTTVRLPEGDKERLEQYAEEHGMNFSEATRRAIDRGLLVDMELQQEVSGHAAD